MASVSPAPLTPDLGEEVAAALSAGRAVVALESTIITHGMPWPQNLETAQAVEAVVRAAGAVPATIALIEGRLKAGLSPDALAALARADSAVKASGRDLAALMVRKATAGTTVSATMRVAALAGIGVFATGGIGGVHRGAEHTFDISADLGELGATPVAVVCAGVKSILDIPKTLEYLETARVPVIAYGTDAFPAFFSRESGAHADHRLDSPAEIAAAIALHGRMGSGTGLLIANPVPEADALEPEYIDTIIARAVGEAAAQGIVGRAVTPFLLARINEVSGGRSLAANISLVRNNARLAAEIAVAGETLRAG
ncbi:pseudouridine-5'-phosphate glycosidase (plasmid) [Paroceanicella profunda]|uniref:Pseudouridine-5'-phosphate glycosidase n=1 Tax=Paroceanicella profunda TaxID=2579971 RepID=A0A5B8G525_9RHOB|nr:pseudouridine-5'-phosphate glycosidase [Paroceanicella profunda]QDL94392.1 pseudouridine-5'-phosphate glycosidase [Paroceanicella profunda]